MRPVPLTAFRLVVALALVPVAVAVGGSAHAAQASGLPPLATVNVTVSPDVSIYQDSYVPKGEVHDGDLVSVMGDVRIEGEVTGQVVVVLGSLDLSGKVRGDVVSVMSRTQLGDTADVDGQLVGVGWSIQRAMGSKVGGQVVNVGFMNLLPFAGHGGGLSGIVRFFFILHCGVLIGVFILAVTIIGLPLAFALWYLAKGIKWVGLASIFYLVGQTAGRNLFRRELPHLASVLGGFVVYALMTLVPGLGWAFNLILSMMALGLALVTRLGSEPVPDAQPAGAPPASGARVTGESPVDPSGVGVPPLVS